MSPNKEKCIKTALWEVLKQDSFDKMFFAAILELKPSPRRINFLIILFALMIYLFFCIPHNSTFPNAAISVIELLNTITLALLAIIITGYTIFYAMMSTDALITFLAQNSDQKSIFLRYNNFFFAITVLYTIFMISNTILLLVLKGLPELFSYFNSIILQVIFMFYIIFSLYAFIEFKSFIYNIYQSIAISSVARTLDLLNNSKKDSSKRLFHLIKKPSRTNH